METPLVSDQICLLHHLANKTDLRREQAYTVREDGEVFASDFLTLLMDFTRKGKQHAEFVTAAALFSVSLRQLLQKLLFHAEKPG